MVVHICFTCLHIKFYADFSNSEAFGTAGVLVGTFAVPKFYPWIYILLHNSKL